MRFLRKLRNSAFKRYYELRYRDRPFIRNYFGADFRINFTDVIGQKIALGIFERELLDNFLKLCRARKIGCFIDIGANAGLYTCVVLKNGAAPRAIAFEPDPDTAARLRGNLDLNGLSSKTEIHQVAVGKERGRVRFMPGPAENTGYARVIAADDPRAAREIEVYPIDDLISLKGETLAIKMDVEDYEIAALSGMKRLLSENRGIVQIETHRTRREVTEMMNALGYHLIGEFTADLVFEKK
jgi:FkbM family methyltransferase